MNDHVVQGLAAALYALQIGNYGTAERSVEFTLDEARAMMRDLSTASGPGAALSVADLTRAQPAVLPLGERLVAVVRGVVARRGGLRAVTGEAADPQSQAAG